MRKFILLVVYLLMIAAGSWAMYDWLVLGGRGRLVKGMSLLAGLGLYLVWMDFLSPNREQL